MAEANLSPAQVSKMKQDYADMKRTIGEITLTAQKYSKNLQDSKKYNEALLTLAREELKEEYKSLDIAKQMGVLTKNELMDKRKSLDLIANTTKELVKQKGLIDATGAAFDRILQKRKQDVELLTKQGKLGRAAFEQFKQSFQSSEAGGFKNNALSAGKRANDVASDPKQLLSAMGPWGEIAKIIIEVIDGVRMMGAELHTASAESGGFADSVTRSRQESLSLYNSQITFAAKYGLEVKEVAKVYEDLKQTGIAALGVIPKTGVAMSELALDTLSFAKATNQSTAQIADQYAQMSRSFNISTGKLTDHYKKVFDVAAGAAELGIAKVSEMMQATFSLADSFKEVGINLDGVTKLVDGVAHAIKALGRPGGIDQIQKIASGILGITKASEGWQVFMAKMSGVGGGFAQTLFSAQQRKADFTLPGANDFDPAKTIDMFKNTLSRTTGGIADPATRQFMVETMGKQVGMDTSTTQVFQKLMSGNLSKSQATSDLKKLHQAAIENNMSSKGMFDILRNILVGMIAKPIVYIWKLLAKTDADKKRAGAMASKLDKAEGGTRSAIGSDRDEFGVLKKSAVGSDVTRSGMMMVHAGNRIAPVAQRKPYGSTPGGGEGGVQINMNFNIDEKSLHKQFQAAEKQTLHYIRKQQKANF